jgi:UrcA family protein
MKRLNTLLIVALALSGSAASLAAAAPAHDEPRTRAIQVSDLDLSQPVAAAHLYRRIEHAAAYVCEPFQSDGLARMMMYRRCVKGAIGRAVAEVHSPLLTQYVARAD